MSIFVKEKFRGRTRSTGPNASAEIAFIIEATAGENETQAEEALLEQAPSTYHNLYAEGIGLFEEIKTGDNLQHQFWEATVRYVLPGIQQRDPGSSRLSFRTTGGTQHILTSLSTPGTYWRDPANVIDFKGAINVESGGGVAGVDIDVPVFEWQELHVFTPEQMTLAYIGALYNLTGTVNFDPWRVFRAGDCKFRGVEGDQRDDGNWEVMFYFSAQKTREIPQVGGITAEGGGPILKAGWDYLWVFYGQEDVSLVGDPDKKVLLPVAQQVNIEKVYETSRFIDLGIGT